MVLDNHECFSGKCREARQNSKKNQIIAAVLSYFSTRVTSIGQIHTVCEPYFLFIYQLHMSSVIYIVFLFLQIMTKYACFLSSHPTRKMAALFKTKFLFEALFWRIVLLLFYQFHLGMLGIFPHFLEFLGWTRQTSPGLKDNLSPISNFISRVSWKWPSEVIFWFWK